MLTKTNKHDLHEGIAWYYAIKVQRSLGAYACIRKAYIDPSDENTCKLDIGNPNVLLNTHTLLESIEKSTGLKAEIFVGHTTLVTLQNARVAYFKTMNSLLDVPMLLLQRGVLLLFIGLILLLFVVYHHMIK